MISSLGQVAVRYGLGTEPKRRRVFLNQDLFEATAEGQGLCKLPLATCHPIRKNDPPTLQLPNPVFSRVQRRRVVTVVLSMTCYVSGRIRVAVASQLQLRIAIYLPSMFHLSAGYRAALIQDYAGNISRKNTRR
jgi:hypothetical protein